MFPLHNFNFSPLLPFKLWYFFFFATQYTQLFLPLILDNVMGFSPATVGYMMGVRRLITFVVAPLFTWLCDLTLHHHLLLTISHVFYYFSSYVLTHVRSLFAVSLAILFREAFLSGCEPSINNAAMAKIEELSTLGNHYGYGKLRFLGSFGWGLTSLLGPLLIDRFFSGNLIVILYIHILLGSLVVGLVAFSLDLKQDLFLRQAERKKATGTVFLLILESQRTIFCTISVLVQGIILGLLQMTLFIYFSSLGVSTTALGLSVSLGCVGEALLFFYASHIWEQFGGPQFGFNLALVSSSLVLVLYSLIQYTSYPMLFFLVVELLYGGTYALFFTSAVAITNEISPPGLATTAQGALTALYSGIGPALGAFLSGIGYETVGAPVMYCSIAALQMIIFLLAIALKVDMYKKTCSGSSEGIDLEIAETTPLLNNSTNFVENATVCSPIEH